MPATRGPHSAASYTSPPRASPVGVQVDGLPQACCEPAADGGPALALAIVGDQPIRFGRGIQRVFDLALVERAGRDPLPELPGGLVQGALRPRAGTLASSSISLVKLSLDT